MRFLITGGAGFIGRWVVKRLIEEGHDVDVIDNLSNGSRKNLEEFEGNECLGLVVSDILDKSALEKLFAKKPDVCVHMAAEINVQDSIENPKKAFDVNVEGTRNILEAARKCGTKVVFLSTCMVYDTADKPISEAHPLNPRSPYAESKLQAENLALEYHKKHGLPVTILRPFNTYGPFQRSDAEGGVVSIFMKNAINKRPINIFGSGEQTRDLLYAEDCATFIIEAALSGDAGGEVINAGTGRDISINDLAGIISSGDVPVQHVAHPHPQSEIMKLVCDSAKAGKLLGWKPETVLEEGIEKLRKWMSVQQ